MKLKVRIDKYEHGSCIYSVTDESYKVIYTIAIRNNKSICTNVKTGTVRTFTGDYPIGCMALIMDEVSKTYPDAKIFIVGKS